MMMRRALTAAPKAAQQARCYASPMGEVGAKFPMAGHESYEVPRRGIYPRMHAGFALCAASFPAMYFWSGFGKQSCFIIDAPSGGH